MNPFAGLAAPDYFNAPSCAVGGPDQNLTVTPALPQLGNLRQVPTL